MSLFLFPGPLIELSLRFLQSSLVQIEAGCNFFISRTPIHLPKGPLNAHSFAETVVALGISSSRRLHRLDDTVSSLHLHPVSCFAAACPPHLGAPNQSQVHSTFGSNLTSVGHLFVVVFVCWPTYTDWIQMPTQECISA